MLRIKLLLLLVFIGYQSAAQQLVKYKEIDTTSLFLEIYNPPDFNINKTYPAMIFFFGGGWNGGTRQHFIHHAKYFSQRGIVCFLADYRIRNVHKTTPFQSLKDAKSAMRFIRSKAKNFHIDPSKIIASGGSAGGHLAAATSFIEAYNETTDDLRISAQPNALVLFNPVIDNGPGGYGYERIGAAYPRFSPIHNIRKGAPPTIIFLGTKDNLIPVETMQYFKIVMDKVGSACVLKLYKDQPHGFFNFNRFENYKATVSAADDFLKELGYLEDLPLVEIKKD